MKPTLLPYLNFNGNAAEAMKFYQSAMGGELTIQTFGEAGMAKDPKDASRTMHALLKNDTLTFMASDSMPGTEVNFGNSVHMSLVGEDKELLTGFFNKLSEGGKISQPLVEAPWGDTFGMFTDKYGIHWMVNIGKIH